MSISHGGSYVVTGDGKIEEVEGPRLTARKQAEAEAKAKRKVKEKDKPVLISQSAEKTNTATKG